VGEAGAIHVRDVLEGWLDGLSDATEAATHAREHMGRDVPDPDPTPQEVAVPVAIRGEELDLALVPTPQAFGGVRWWLRCGRCGVRRSAIYAVRTTTGGVAVGCRACLRLKYQTQHAEPAHRHQCTLHRIVRRLGGPTSGYGIPDLPPKPPRMHWGTYDRLADAYDAAEWRRLAPLHTVTVARTFARFGP
jgi:hypothetical protein